MAQLPSTIPASQRTPEGTIKFGGYFEPNHRADSGKGVGQRREQGLMRTANRSRVFLRTSNSRCLGGVVYF
jgi:hypothetical protein